MKKLRKNLMFKSLGVLFFVFICGIFIPKIFLQDLSMLSVKDISYAKNVARQILDNPIEKILIIETVVTEMKDGVFTTESYIWGGIPYATTEVYYQKGAKVTWRRFFNDYEKTNTIRFSDSPIDLQVDEELLVESGDTLYRDDAINLYLESQKDFAWTTESGSKNICVFENLGNKDSLFPLSLWVRCGEFSIKENTLTELSGISVPVLIDYPNILSFYDPQKMSHTKPRDGNLYDKDIKNIFPKEVQKKILNHHVSDSLQELLFSTASKKLLAE